MVKMNNQDWEWGILKELGVEDTEETYENFLELMYELQWLYIDEDEDE